MHDNGNRLLILQRCVVGLTFVGAGLPAIRFHRTRHTQPSIAGKPAPTASLYSYSIKQSECAIDLSSQFTSLKHRLPDESRDPEAATRQPVQMTPN
jgi:hypothetical protein